MQNAPHLSVSKFVSLAFQKFPIPCIFLRNYLASSFPLLTACIMFGNLFLIITVNIANMGFALEEFKYIMLHYAFALLEQIYFLGTFCLLFSM